MKSVPISQDVSIFIHDSKVSVIVGYSMLFFNLTIKLLLFFRKNLYASFNKLYFTDKEVKI